MHDPFSVLGLSPSTATFLEAREKYRALTRRHHPDLGTGDAGFMSRLTEAWRSIRTPAAFEEAARAILARSSAPDTTQVAAPHLHDVHTHDGIIHLGPFTRGAMTAAIAERVARMEKAATGGILARLSGRKAPRLEAPAAMVPAAFALTADRITLYAGRSGRTGPHLVGCPSVRLVDGQISYSGKVVETRDVELGDDWTGVAGLGTMEIGDGRRLDILLILSEPA